MPRQAIQDAVDFYVLTAAELTSEVDDLRLADGTRAWVRAPGVQHGLWCLDQTSALPPSPTVVPTMSGTGRWISFGAGGGGGGVPPGNPNAFAYYDPAGVTIVTDANLVAAPLDAFGRPQIWDHRNLGPGLGTIWRQGAWQVAGDAVSTKASGIVSYGSSALGVGPSATDGGEFLATPHSFGQYQVVNGVNGNNPFPVCAWEDGSADAPGIGTPNAFVMRDDANVLTVRLDRLTGDFTIIGSVAMGPSGAPDTRIQRVPPSGKPQIQVDDDAGGSVYVIPAADQQNKLGTRSVVDGGSDAVSKRWAEVNAVVVNTGDLNLIDQDKGAHWTIVEEADCIVVINQKTGKRYRMALEEIE